MTATFTFYLVDENILPADFTGLADQEIYEQLLDVIESTAQYYDSIEMTEDDFIDSLESIDQRLELDRLLPISAMNSSPHDVLGKSGDCPFFGYFSPAIVQMLQSVIESKSVEELESIDSVETHSEVFEFIRAAVEQAALKEEAIAVVHS